MIKYSLVMRGEPRHPERPKKAYASAQSEKLVEFDELVEHILSHGCAYSKGDFFAVVKLLAEGAREMLLDGKQVSLDDLGKFSITLGCEGAESMEQFNPKEHIKEVRTNWTPSPQFKNLRNSVTFEETVNRRVQKEMKRAMKSGDESIEL